MQSTVKLQTLQFSNYKTYIFALLFILGNIILPQIFHFVPQGGVTWLPIYFFTLIGAYLYGWRVGLLTAVLSPVVNCMLFGMPIPAVLPNILLKSILLAGFAGYAAYRFKKVSLAALFAVVLGYQVIGTLGEWAIIGNLYSACQDFRIGIPGMLMQIFLGYALLRITQRSK